MEWFGVLPDGPSGGGTLLALDGEGKANGAIMRLEPCTLEGRVVRLEPLALSHLEGLCRVGLDPELWRLTVSKVATPDDMRCYVDAALQAQGEGTALPFATVWRASDQVIGSTRFANAALEHRRVEIGWTWLGRPWQRSGANAEAKYLMLRHAFEVWDLVRVELKTSALNQQSRGAMRKLGAVEEGVLRRHMINEDGSPRDSVFYSILADEWPKVKAGLEERLRDFSPGRGLPARPAPPAPA